MVNLEYINNVAKNFRIDSACVSFSELKSGHINDTFLIISAKNKKYVLQKTNTHVFKNIDAIVNNKQYFSNYFKARKQQLNYSIIEFVETSEGLTTYLDKKGNYWNMTHFIEDSKTIEIPDNDAIVFESGKLYGDFIYQTSSIDILKFKETIVDFHNVSWRFSQFQDALKNPKIDLEFISNIIKKVINYKKEMCVLSTLKAENKIPIRLTHNDTKLSNILFNQENKGLAVIDLDTLMSGIIHFDFGDSIRSICSTAKEDEQNLDLVNFNIEYYEAYCKGYAMFTKTILSPIEIKYLPLSIKTMIYIMGLRFLTDHINGNIYYKVAYKEHNLVRAKNQFKLLESVHKNFDQIIEITNTYFTK